MDLWLWLKYTLLGLFQGFTEPIPVSSSGHLVIAQHLFGLKIEGLSFEVLVNFASLLAVLLVYREDLIRLTRGGLLYIRHRDPEYRSEYRFIIFIIIATIPAGVIGVLFNDFIAGSLKGLAIVGATLLVTALALWLIRNMRGHKGESDITVKDAIIIGLGQAIALIPGISRSGATIVAAMGIGLKQATALRFSFLMFIPISLGGMVLEFEELANDPHLDTLLIPYILAFLGSLVASYYSLRWFMNIMARGNLKIFSWYCVIAGTAVLIYSLT